MFKFFRNKKIKVVFSHQYSFGLPDEKFVQIFDIQKYKKIRDLLIEKKLVKRKNILIPEPVDYKDIKLVHTDDFVQKIKDPINVSRMLNLDIPNFWDNDILEYFRIVTGGTVLATSHALQNGNVVFNLGGGFHHAHPDKASGYCLLNDVAIAVQKVREMKLAQKFVIIDLDYHQGDGNLVFFKNDSHVYTMSMHATQWSEEYKVNNLDIVIPTDIKGREYLDLLNNNINGLCSKFKPDLVFYIAGSDPYENDSLCDMKLTRNDLLNRNLLIFNKIYDLNLPMVVLPAGGYGPDSWHIYYDFIKHVLKK